MTYPSGLACSTCERARGQRGVLKVENGRRTDLAVQGEGRTYGVKGYARRPVEHVACGRRWTPVTVHFNGTKRYDVEDATFSRAGRVRVWTKADSVTHFDDLTVVTT